MSGAEGLQRRVGHSLSDSDWRVNGFVNVAPHREAQSHLTKPHIEGLAIRYDLPGPTAATLDLTTTRGLAVRRFVGSSPVASTKSSS